MCPILKHTLKPQQLKRMVLPQNRQTNQWNKIKILEISWNTSGNVVHNIDDIYNEWRESVLFNFVIKHFRSCLEKIKLDPYFTSYAWINPKCKIIKTPKQ